MISIPGRRVDWFKTLDSTMLEARRDPEPGRIVVADEQTSGMGRHGRSWHSAAGEGLYVTFVLAIQSAPILTLALGLATREVIGQQADLRWPNDVLLSEKKCAGILAQTEGERVLAGIGINVSQQSFPDNLDTPATSLALEGIWTTREALLVALAFAIDRVKSLAPQHPEWKDKEPFASLLKGDVKGALAGGEPAIFKIVMATHADMTTDEFEKIVRDWIATAKHPVSKRLYTQMVYQPMLELLDFLRANGFKTFIVSGGGVDFMRVFSEKFYGIPPEQVIGSSGKLKFEGRDGKPALMKLPELNFFDDKAGKPVGIQTYIGRRPVMAFGNSDGAPPRSRSGESAKNLARVSDKLPGKDVHSY